MISNRCARKSLVTNCNSIISKNYLRFLVDSNDIRYNDHLLENLEYIPFVLSNIKRNNDMEKKLVYRYSDAICEKCVSEDLELLDSFQNVIGRNHVFIYTSFPENRNNKLRLRSELFGFTYKNDADVSDM